MKHDDLDPPPEGLTESRDMIFKKSEPSKTVESISWSRAVQVADQEPSRQGSDQKGRGPGILRNEDA